MEGSVKKPLLSTIAKYIQWILQCTGLEYRLDMAQDSIVTPVLDILSQFRDVVRA